MASWIDKILGKNADQPAFNNESADELQREVRRLQMDIQEKDQTIARLKSDIESQRGGENTRISAVTDSKLERLFDSIASPAAQLATQAYLIKTGKPVQARDVIAVAGSLVRTFETEGFKVDELTDTPHVHNPDLHQSISSEVSIKGGETIIVRLPGVTYNNKILRKAGVEKVGE